MPAAEGPLWDLFCKMLASAALWGFGDFIAQKVEGRKTKEPYDLLRTAKIAFWAFLFFTPIVSTWFDFLEAQLPGTSFDVALQRMICDQFMMAPFVLSLFFCVTALMDGKGINGAIMKVKENIWNTLKVNWMIWPLVQVINFSFIPPHERVLFVNIINMPWTAYLAYQAAQRGSSKASSTPSKIEMTDV